MNFALKHFIVNTLRTVYLRDILHLTAIWAFAVAQPLYDILGRFPEIFVNKEAGPFELFFLTLLLSLILPSLFFIPLFLAALINEIGYKIILRFLFFSLFTILVLPLIKKIELLPDWWKIILALLVAAFLLYFFMRREHFFKMALDYISPAILLFPIIFLFFTPVRGLLSNPVNSVDSKTPVVIKNPVPIVMVFFDEIAIHYLMDSSGDIDPIRFPNFSRLKNTSHWFKNAITVEDSTTYSVPTMLTGNYYSGNKMPTLRDYPNNLLALLEGNYRLNIVETATNLLPRRPKNKRDLTFWIEMSSDLGIVWQYIILPLRFTQRLPDVTLAWGNFGENNIPINIHPNKKQNLFKFIVNSLNNDRSKIFRDFINSLKKSDEPTIHFLDLGLPHPPFIYHPSGKYYENFTIDGLKDELWNNEPPLVEIGFRRYMMQLEFVDKLLGELIAKLEEIGLMEDCLLIVAADHGSSYYSGEFRRPLTSGNLGDILSIPLFMKLPGQKSGVIETRWMETVDILPTIAEIIGMKLPKKPDGNSIFSENFKQKENFKFHSVKNNTNFIFTSTEIENSRQKSWKRTLDMFDPKKNGPWYLYSSGPFKELVGLNYKSIKINPDKSNLNFEIANLENYNNIDIKQQFIPGLITGTIFNNDKVFGQKNSIALVINDVIWATAERPNGLFSFLVPDAAFINGKNVFRVFEIRNEAEGINLTELFNNS